MNYLLWSNRRRAHPRWTAWPHAALVRCLYTPFASAALAEKNWMRSAARAGAMTSEEILAKAPAVGRRGWRTSTTRLKVKMALRATPRGIFLRPGASPAVKVAQEQSSLVLSPTDTD